MAIVIGPNFGNELVAAGLSNVHMSWSPDGALIFGSDATPQQEAAVQAVLAAHNPATPDQLALVAQGEAQLDAVLVAGVPVVSASAPDKINGTYACDLKAQGRISGVAAGIGSRNRLPGGGATFFFADRLGQDHEFTSAQFLDFAAAVEDYIYKLSKGQPPALPLAIG